MLWWSAGNGTSTIAESSNKGYSFTYDDLSCLKYTFKERLISLKRYGRTDEDNYGLIDDLHIMLCGNQLKSVTDHSTSSAYNYGFEYKDGSSSEVE